MNPLAGGAGGNTSLMPGDWICEVCENNNFARRRECRRCGTPRSNTSTTIDESNQGTQGAGGGRGPGGFGGGGGGHYGGGGGGYGGGGGQYGGGGGGQYGGGGGPGGPGGAAAAPPPGSGGGGAAYVPGDWICGSCQNHNFQWRQECKRCQAPRATDSQVVGKDGSAGAPPGSGAPPPPPLRSGDAPAIALPPSLEDPEPEIPGTAAPAKSEVVAEAAATTTKKRAAETESDSSDDERDAKRKKAAKDEDEK